MKVSMNWLREYVELDMHHDQLAHVLTFAGVEVEGIEHRGAALDNVVVAQVLESVQHPNADRLSVCQVDDGSGTRRQIVCGAKNYKVGDKVPLALPGAVLPGDFKIKVGKLRGVESQGMMCSAKELSLAEDAEGLLILSPDAPVGRPIGEVFPPDAVFDLEITPNRPDLLSYVGIAREVATLTRKTLKAPALTEPQTGEGSVKVRIDATRECPFYSGRVIRGVKVGPSPEWLKAKLEAAGLRAINNIVDVTNYVLLELGQPLHAFDLAKLSGGITVRLAKEQEKFLALDGKTYPLTKDQLVIADESKAVAIAGVMGGEDTGVTEGSVDLLLESAWFLPSSVRRTSRALGLISDSSYRFERGVDAGLVLQASQRAVDLILQVAGGTAEPVTITAGTAPIARHKTKLRYERCNQLAGVEVPPDRVDSILQGFGLEKSGECEWTAPTFRQDLSREVDLIEEVVRVFGIENIPSRATCVLTHSTEADRLHDFLTQTRRVLAGFGLSESRKTTLVADAEAARDPFASDELLRVRNPMYEDQVVLRPGLTGGLLTATAHNVRMGAGSVALFEMGRTFRNGAPEEQHRTAILLYGEAVPASWRGPGRTYDYYDLRGMVQAWIPDAEFRPATNERAAAAAEIWARGRRIGWAGQILPKVCRELDLRDAVVVAEFITAEVQALFSQRSRFSAYSNYPAVTRDVAFLVPEKITHGEVAGAIASANEPLLEQVSLFDLFADPKGEKVPLGSKSMAYSLTYRASDRTLSTDEVNGAHARVKETLKAALGVQFRE